MYVCIYMFGNDYVMNTMGLNHSRANCCIPDAIPVLVYMKLN